MFNIKASLAAVFCAMATMSDLLFAQGSMGKWPHKGGAASPTAKIIVVVVLIIVVVALAYAVIEHNKSSRR